MFERLEVIREVVPVNSKRRVLVRCQCGEEKEVDRYKLVNGIIKSCGCLSREIALAPRAKDLTDQVFGKLTARQRDGNKRLGGSAVWLCECECGKVVTVTARDLVSKNTRSCGCVNTEFLSSLLDRNLREKSVDGIFVPLLTQKVQTNSVTDVKGVSVRYTKQGIKYIANITVNNKRIYLGIYSLLDDAIKARQEAEELYFQPIIEKYEQKEQEE